MDTSKRTSELRTRKVNAILTGDSAVDAELLIVKLGLSDSGKKKADVDAELVKLALEALNAVVEATRMEIGNKHPSIDDVRDTMGKRLVVSHG